MNPVERFFERHIDKLDFEICGVSSNTSITGLFIEHHINENWDWGEYCLSLNPYITLEFMENHLDKNWEWGFRGLSSNPSITFEFIERHLDKYWVWGKNGISCNTFTKELNIWKTDCRNKYYNSLFSMIK